MKYELLPETKTLESGEVLYRIRALRAFNSISVGDLGGWVESAANLSQEGDCWIYDEACVYGQAQILQDAKVMSRAHVFGSAVVQNKARVNGEAKVSGDAIIFEHAYITCSCDISRHARIYGFASLYDDAKVTDYAQVFGHASLRTGVHIGGQAQIYGQAKLDGEMHVNYFTKIYGDAYVSGAAAIRTDEDIVWFSSVGSQRGTLTAFRTTEGVSVTRGCFSGTLDAFEIAVVNTHRNNKVAKEYRVLIDYIRLRFNVEKKLTLEDAVHNHMRDEGYSKLQIGAFLKMYGEELLQSYNENQFLFRLLRDYKPQIIKSIVE